MERFPTSFAWTGQFLVVTLSRTTVFLYASPRLHATIDLEGYMRQRYECIPHLRGAFSLFEQEAQTHVVVYDNTGCHHQLGVCNSTLTVEYVCSFSPHADLARAVYADRRHFGTRTGVVGDLYTDARMHLEGEVLCVHDHMHVTTSGIYHRSQCVYNAAIAKCIALHTGGFACLLANSHQVIYFHQQKATAVVATEVSNLFEARKGGVVQGFFCVCAGAYVLWEGSPPTRKEDAVVVTSPMQTCDFCDKRLDPSVAVWDDDGKWTLFFWNVLFRVGPHVVVPDDALSWAPGDFNASSDNNNVLLSKSTRNQWTVLDVDTHEVLGIVARVPKPAWRHRHMAKRVSVLAAHAAADADGTIWILSPPRVPLCTSHGGE